MKAFTSTRSYLAKGQATTVGNVEHKVASRAEALPSAGSQLHGIVLPNGHFACQPCIGIWKATGCLNGKACKFCHLCPKDELKRRQIESKRHKMHAARRSGTVDAWALPESQPMFAEPYRIQMDHVRKQSKAGHVPGFHTFGQRKSHLSCSANRELSRFELNYGPPWPSSPGMTHGLDMVDDDPAFIVGINSSLPSKGMFPPHVPARVPSQVWTQGSPILPLPPAASRAPVEPAVVAVQVDALHTPSPPHTSLRNKLSSPAKLGKQRNQKNAKAPAIGYETLRVPLDHQCSREIDTNSSSSSEVPGPNSLWGLQDDVENHDCRWWQGQRVL